MEVPAARLEDGLQLRDLLAQLVMPRVAGRTSGAQAPSPDHPPARNTDGQGSARSGQDRSRARQSMATSTPSNSQAAHGRAYPVPAQRAESDLAPAPPPEPAQVDQAARHLVRGDSAPLEALLHTSSGSRTAVAEAVLAPVARRLGVLWEDDDASFAEVSAGLGLLSRRFAALPVTTASDAAMSGAADGGSILLVPAPGDTHVFALSVVGAAFEEAGWTVMCHPAASRAEIIEQVASRWIDVLAITVSWTDAMRRVPDLVAAARLASLNPDLKVLAGGGAVAQLDGACAALQADAVAVSAVQAVTVARQMLGSRATPV